MKYKKLVPRVKKLWLEELRGGDFYQGRQALCREVGQGKSELCCLGVLCAIAYEEYVTEEKVEPWYRFYGSGFSSVPPPEVTLWANLDNNARDKLIDLNDEQHKSFTDIADWIEENL